MDKLHKLGDSYNSCYTGVRKHRHAGMVLKYSIRVSFVNSGVYGCDYFKYTSNTVYMQLVCFTNRTSKKNSVWKKDYQRIPTADFCQ